MSSPESSEVVECEAVEESERGMEDESAQAGIRIAHIQSDLCAWVESVCLQCPWELMQ